jgi:hypothetical protein
MRNQGVEEGWSSSGVCFLLSKPAREDTRSSLSSGFQILRRFKSLSAPPPSSGPSQQDRATGAVGPACSATQSPRSSLAARRAHGAGRSLCIIFCFACFCMPALLCILSRWMGGNRCVCVVHGKAALKPASGKHFGGWGSS